MRPEIHCVKLGWSCQSVSLTSRMASLDRAPGKSCLLAKTSSVAPANLCRGERTRKSMTPSHNSAHNSCVPRAAWCSASFQWTVWIAHICEELCCLSNPTQSSVCCIETVYLQQSVSSHSRCDRPDQSVSLVYKHHTNEPNQQTVLFQASTNPLLLSKLLQLSHLQ